MTDTLIVLLTALLAALAGIALLWRIRRRNRARRWVILDGSNVMHWRNETPDFAPLREVLKHCAKRGLSTGVVFDANAGYKLSGRFMNDRALARRLGLPVKHVMVVPKGTPADYYILQAARDYGASIISNDHFRDWRTDFPELTGKANPSIALIQGRYHRNRLQLDWP